MPTAEEIIQLLDLQPLPEEGGYYKETFRSKQKTNENRNLASGIYYLVTPADFSALHRLSSDETFHFYAGDPLEMIQVDPNGKLTSHRLGSDLSNGFRPQALVPAGCWQGTRLMEGGSWGLVGCMTTPGYDPGDFELGKIESLAKSFPQHAPLLRQYTRE